MAGGTGLPLFSRCRELIDSQYIHVIHDTLCIHLTNLNTAVGTDLPFETSLLPYSSADGLCVHRLIDVTYIMYLSQISTRQVVRIYHFNSCCYLLMDWYMRYIYVGIYMYIYIYGTYM